MIQAHGNQKKAGIAIITSDKIDLKPKKVNKKQRQTLIMMETIHPVDITVINIYAPNTGAQNTYSNY